VIAHQQRDLVAALVEACPGWAIRPWVISQTSSSWTAAPRRCHRVRHGLPDAAFTRSLINLSVLALIVVLAAGFIIASLVAS